MVALYILLLHLFNGSTYNLLEGHCMADQFALEILFGSLAFVEDHQENFWDPDSLTTHAYVRPNLPFLTLADHEIGGISYS